MEVARARGGFWSHLSVVIKAGAVVTKLSPYARLLSAASILREQQTHYREGREKKRKNGSGKEREGGGGTEKRGGGGGVFRGLWLKD